MHMIYVPPTLEDVDLAVLEAIEQLRRDLRYYLVQPRRWLGSLRRVTFARAVQGSNSIEGYDASVEDVAAVIEGEEPLETGSETRAAIAGYRDAMTYVLGLADNPPPLDISLARSLHFMVMKHDLSKNPGRWRPGGIWIENGEGEVVYEAPDRDLVEGLMLEAMLQTSDETSPVMVRAAMAHLNVTLVHPFSDGNGRMARCLQTYVLASDGPVSPVFASIEEYLGHDTLGYYAILSETSGGTWSPERDTLPWIRYCLTAHYRQVVTLQRRIRETELLWDRCEQLASGKRLPPRTVVALCDAARGWRLRRSLYRKLVLSSTGEELSEPMATRDLRLLTERGLLQPVGERRRRIYEPTPELRAVWNDIRDLRLPFVQIDPYEAVRNG